MARTKAITDPAMSEAAPPPRKVAWRVTTRGFKEAGIYAAATRSKAVASSYNACRDVGYSVTWTDIKAKRAPEYDAWAKATKARHGMIEECVKAELEGV